MNNYYSNFQRFDNKGNRLSILGREKDGMLEVFVLKCHKNDKFYKVFAAYRYDRYIRNLKIPDIHPKIELIVIENGDTGKYTFKKYCELYYKKQTTVIIQQKPMPRTQHQYYC